MGKMRFGHVKEFEKTGKTDFGRVKKIH